MEFIPIHKLSQQIGASQLNPKLRLACKREVLKRTFESFELFWNDLGWWAYPGFSSFQYSWFMGVSSNWKPISRSQPASIQIWRPTQVYNTASWQFPLTSILSGLILLQTTMVGPSEWWQRIIGLGPWAAASFCRETQMDLNGPTRPKQSGPKRLPVAPGGQGSRGH